MQVNASYSYSEKKYINVCLSVIYPEKERIIKNGEEY